MGDIFWGALPKKEILFLGGGVRNMLRRPGAVTQLLHTAQGVRGNNDPDQECALFK